MLEVMDKAEMPAKPEMEENEVCVPLKALAQPDEQDQMQTPAEGDSGSMQVDYVITRIEGENAYIKPMSINGTDLEAEKEENNEGEVPADTAEGNALREEAEKMSY